MRPFGRPLSFQYRQGHPGHLMRCRDALSDRIWPTLLDIRLAGIFNRYRDAAGWDLLRSVDSMRQPVLALEYRP